MIIRKPEHVQHKIGVCYIRFDTKHLILFALHLLEKWNMYNLKYGRYISKKVYYDLYNIILSKYTFLRLDQLRIKSLNVQKSMELCFPR